MIERKYGKRHEHIAIIGVNACTPRARHRHPHTPHHSTLSRDIDSVHAGGVKRRVHVHEPCAQCGQRPQRQCRSGGDRARDRTSLPLGICSERAIGAVWMTTYGISCVLEHEQQRRLNTVDRKRDADHITSRGVRNGGRDRARHSTLLAMSRALDQCDISTGTNINISGDTHEINKL